MLHILLLEVQEFKEDFFFLPTLFKRESKGDRGKKKENAPPKNMEEVESLLTLRRRLQRCKNFGERERIKKSRKSSSFLTI